MKKSKAQLNFENNPFSYRDYVAEIRYSRLDASLVGQLKGMKTLLIFKGQSLDEMKIKFRETVDNYLLECEQEGKEPEKQFATDTIISIPTELYREYVQTSEELGKNEHELISEILEEQLNVIKSEIYAEKGNMLNIYLWPDMDFYKYPLMYKGFGGFVIRHENKFVGMLLNVEEEYIFEGSTEAEVIHNFRETAERCMKEQNLSEGPFNGKLNINVKPKFQYLLSVFAAGQGCDLSQYMTDNLLYSFDEERQNLGDREVAELMVRKYRDEEG